MYLLSMIDRHDLLGLRAQGKTMEEIVTPDPTATKNDLRSGYDRLLEIVCTDSLGEFSMRRWLPQLIDAFDCDLSMWPQSAQ